MSEPASVGPGTLLADRYELTALIGRGGFGEVYRAKQLNMDRDVAVKILPAEFMSVHDVVARFKREAKLASRLRHPNTITLHDYGQHEEMLFIVMELLEGEDLADLLAVEGRLALERIYRVAIGILKSLAEAHEHGIVHRDLKPENIFLSVVGEDKDHVKVLDFGIAKLALPEKAKQQNNERKLTLTGSTVGTPAYMSPEQAAGEEVDGQSDLYALGIMMYEMADGRPPFHGKDLVKIMRAHLFEPVPRFRDKSLHHSIFERVVMKALQKEKGKRFKTASEFLLALAGGPVVKPLIQGIPKPMQRNASQEIQDNALDMRSDTSDTSDTSDDAFNFVIPDEGNIPAPIKASDSSTSSIIQVISHHARDVSVEEPVILLTKRKLSPEKVNSIQREASKTNVFNAQKEGSEVWAFEENRENYHQNKRAPIGIVIFVFLLLLGTLAWVFRSFWI